ncbi:MFS general substrate transporter [Vararia minispora EC-137]|uniref:MFS general substrate transporter n=1 Tax=Vararia minispora EC-137 TaxID=1314806 RepID=A0ACB8QJS6_9AGAM|nr:MFS general substrate transporter [Vararia minispora EC-137]
MSAVASSSTSSVVSDVEPARTWKSYIWDTWDKSPEERRFLARLDMCLITYAALSYFSKYLDQQNVTNAYVSGMQEDLRLHGNQLNYITTAWTCGYVIGQIPSNMLITRIRPSLWIPAMEVIWSVLTMCLAASRNFSTLVAIRFFVGLAESTFYPAIQYVIGSWYKNEELAKRACIFHTMSAVGPMVSGVLQAGVYNNLNGSGGLAGWRWLFIVDGLITIPIALIGFVIMPDLPTTTKPSWIYTRHQLDIAVARMESVGRKPPAQFTKAKIRSFFTTWHIWTLVPRKPALIYPHIVDIDSHPGLSVYVLFNNGNGGNTSMIFWLKSFNTIEKRTVYTVSQINTYPLALAYAWWSDIVEARWPPMIFAGTWSLITYVVLAATPVYTHIARRWIFYYFVPSSLLSHSLLALTLKQTGAMGGLSGLILAWANELTGNDNEKRSFVVASCNMWAYVFQAWLPIVIFPQVEQPTVFRGNVTTACINFTMMVFAMLTLYMQNRYEGRKRKPSSAAGPVEESWDPTVEVDVKDRDSLVVE